MLSLWSDPMSIPGGMDIDACFSVVALVADLAVWQPEWNWWNEQDRSQMEAEAEVETMRSDNSATSDLVIAITS